MRRALIATLLLVGCALRFRIYLFDRTLWLSEAALAFNVLHLSPRALLGPLEWHQTAPAGFLWIVQLVTALFGSGERMLRLVPFVCGLATLPLFYLTAQRLASRNAAVLATGLFAVTPWLVHWSAETKPYMSDVLLTLSATLWAASLVEGKLTAAATWRFAVFGGLAIFCAFPMLMVLPAIVFALGWHAVALGDRERMGRVAVLAGVWLCAGAAYYVISVQPLLQHGLIPSLWREEFLTVADWQHSRRLLSAAFSVPAGLAAEHPWPIVPVFAIGCAAMLKRNPFRSALIVLPLVLAVVASFLQLYPFWHRVIMFLAPVLLLGVAEGVVSIATAARTIWRPAGVVAAAVMIAAIGHRSMVKILEGPRDYMVIRPLLADLAAHVQAGDTIYVGEFEAMYVYYAPRFGLGERPYLVGRLIDTEWQPKYDEQLDALRGRSRVWAMTTDEAVPRRLDRLGRRLASSASPDIALYLYDLGLPPAGSTSP